jgi:hypothetical protein
MIYCRINVEKLKKVEFSSYSHKLIKIERENSDVWTTFVFNRRGVTIKKMGNIRDGILFFKKHNVDDKFIYDLLTLFIASRNS